MTKRILWIVLALCLALGVTLYAQGVIRLTSIEWTSISGTRSGVYDTFGPGTPEGGVVAEPGSLYRDTTNGTIYVKETGSGNTGWTEIDPTAGAPTDATYITQTADGTLSAEQAMGALGTGLVINTTTTGVQSIYAGDACSAGDFVTDVAADGTLTCDTPAAGGGGTAAIGVVIDGGGSAITTGFKGCSYVPYDGTIAAATIISHEDGTPISGSIVIDVWVDDRATAYPPTVADTITASAKPTLSSATNSHDATLTGWTTAFSAGDVFCYSVDSVTDVEKVTLTLTVTKS